MSDLIYLAQNLKHLRTKNRLSQQKVADFLGLKCGTYNRWENSNICPSLDQLGTLAKLFNVSIEMLVNGKEREFKDEYEPEIDIVLYVTVY